MRHHKKEQKSPEGQSKSTPSRFRIEKLEERIAPAQGGIPGKPPGDTFCLYDCHPGRHHPGGLA
jgi:hypothetical protein